MDKLVYRTALTLVLSLLVLSLVDHTHGEGLYTPMRAPFVVWVADGSWSRRLASAVARWDPGRG